jgi:hypothetical protein
MDRSLFGRLLSLDDGDMYDVIQDCVSQYMQYLADIAADIYDSCIRLYYATYHPKIYDRHGHIEGYNLYQANCIRSEYLSVTGGFYEDNLWQYEDRRRDIRQDVLDSVMIGIRGGGARRRKWKGWPQNWDARYPNAYSQYRDWHSSYDNINDILDDFMENAVTATKDYFFELLSSYI